MRYCLLIIIILFIYSIWFNFLFYFFSFILLLYFIACRHPMRPPCRPPAPEAPSKLRTVADLRNCRDEKRSQLPATMPMGPWATDKEAMDDISTWAENTKLCRGGYGVSWGARRKPNRVRGEQHVMFCHMLARPPLPRRWTTALKRRRRRAWGCSGA